MAVFFMIKSTTNRELCKIAFSVIARHEVPWQSDELSICYEIASLAQRRRLRRVSLAMTSWALCKAFE